MQTKATGDTPHYFRTAKHAKRSRKFKEGVGKKKKGRPRKMKGRLPSDNPAAALPGYVE
jgi:hypothetical protein